MSLPEDIERHIARRIQFLIRKHEFLRPEHPTEEWAAYLCLEYWAHFCGLTYAKSYRLVKMPSPETILRIARKYNLTPGKYTALSSSTGSAALDSFISGQTEE